MYIKNNFISAITIIFALLTISTLVVVKDIKSEPVQNTSTLTEVDAKYVCMVTDKLFPKEQIPVVVSDKTYYGCCEMCREQLANNPDLRNSVDPVSGKKVDKANSVIGAASNGDIYYFENKENLKKFSTIK